MIMCWTSRAGSAPRQVLLARKVAPPSSELEGETSQGLGERGISNSRPALVCPPGALVPSWPPLSPLSAGATQAGCVFLPPVSLLCYWVGQACQMRTALVCWKASDWQLGLTTLSQASIKDSHCLVRRRDYKGSDCWVSVCHAGTTAPL